MKSKAPSTKDRQLAQLEYDKTHQALVDSLKELEPLVTPLMTQYHELALDKEVVKALADLQKNTGVTFKMGPSDELKAAANLLKQLKLVPKHKKGVATKKDAAKK